MPVESWINPEETAALAAEAVTRIDAALSRLSPTEREAFWSSVRKCYNTPYNDPAPRHDAIPTPPQPATAMAALPVHASLAAEAHAL